MLDFAKFATTFLFPSYEIADQTSYNGVKLIWKKTLFTELYMNRVIYAIRKHDVKQVAKEMCVYV